MSEQIEEIKEGIQSTLSKSFVDDMEVNRREMEMLNVLLKSFDGGEYTYDEYCKNRMNYELEACDKVVKIDFEEEFKMTKQETAIIQNRAHIKYNSNPNEDFDDLYKEEWIKWQVEKSVMIDKKIFYPVSRYSSIKLLKLKLSEEVWIDKKSYFENIVEKKARNSADVIANNNKDHHEEQIRANNI